MSVSHLICPFSQKIVVIKVKHEILFNIPVLTSLIFIEKYPLMSLNCSDETGKDGEILHNNLVS